MTDKEIIINGIDVSECVYLKPLDNGVYECIAGTQQCLKYRVCECNHNCYFKQLKRKEEELQAQRNFTTQDRLKYKQALDEIEKYLDAQQKYFDGEDYHNLLDIINEAKE